MLENTPVQNFTDRMHNIDSQFLSKHFDLDAGAIEGAPVTKRHLSDLRGSFADERAYEAALAKGDALLYTVASIEPSRGEGQLHYGLGVLMPGKIGDEYFLTKGHYHSWRPAAEVYVGLRGQGKMLLEDEETGESRLVDLVANSAVYVPGHTAHRTLNTSQEPLVYLGIYPAQAGHDYGTVGKRNFLKVLIERNGDPVLMERSEYLATPNH